ncbi:urea ABC transporter ATP-binding subunit UrtE [Pararhodospirillum photometricum]|uniref:ATP-binding component of ABC transporter n=1 Tax=Pararhodospirillum photometricum DSM 122 TaxID=1150469 RepID=H6SJM4_PARPM|nr:urea ABC transporter ATP-binding subunit UrtE [Pararhodospirillum photometricum]CCG08189.1 ATP-binding component of ABC transporter [Pararhodospirillum photometricum DSM 122]
MLEIKDITLFYGASQALRGVSLSAPPAGVTCVLGRNGVGKTSLMRAILGLQTVRDGAIVWEGEDITRLSPYERARRGLGFVPQGREIFTRLSVRENLETGFAPLPRAKRTIPEEIFTLFPVLKTMLGRRGGDLSGGQQQQLAIARALVTRPRLLILDEPTEGIQPSIIKDIGRVIRLLAEGQLTEWGPLTVVLVEQYFDFARDLADHFAVMDRGEVVLAGAAAAMVEDQVRPYLTV